VTPVKRYLLIFFGIYIGVGLIANFLMGPPGFSKAYQQKYKAEHERYLEIVKSDEYKLHAQRPALHPFDPALTAFIEEYEGREEFKREKLRQALYHNFFQFFTFIMLVVLAVHFGRKPLLDFLDGQIADLRVKIDRAKQTREAAAQRKQGAQEKMGRLHEEKEETARETEALIAREKAQFEDLTRLTLGHVDRETEDRKREEEHAAAQRVKEELVAQSIDLLVERYKAQASPQVDLAQIDQFIREVERRT